MRRDMSVPFVGDPPIIHHGARIATGAIILPGTDVGRNAVVGAGAVVTRNVPERCMVIGNPAMIRGIIDDEDCV